MFSVTSAEFRITRMLTWLAGVAQSKLTDFIIGSVARSKIEAIAVEMEAQEFQVYQGIQDAIPVAVYDSFGFPLLSAQPATGNVTFSAATIAAADIPIPKGTVVTTASGSPAFMTTAATFIPSGSISTTAIVQCTAAGTVGNVDAATITRLQSAVSGVSTVTNAARLSNGTAAENNADRAVRFQKYLASLSRGTKAALEYGALQAVYQSESVKAVKVVAAEEQSPIAPGHPLVYVWNGTGTASANLLAAVATILTNDYKAAGDVLRAGTEILSCVVNPLDFTVALSLMSGYDQTTLRLAAQGEIDGYILSLGVGEKVVHSEIVKRIMALAGVYSVHLSVPSDDVVQDANKVATVHQVSFV